MHLNNLESIWVDRSGKEYKINEMGDAHLFAVMEALLKLARMKRRKNLEYLTSLAEMYDEESLPYLSEGSIEAKNYIDTQLDKINSMNTDAYGMEYISHYEFIMREAAAREMREPFNPIFDKSDA